MLGTGVTVKTALSTLLPGAAMFLISEQMPDVLHILPGVDIAYSVLFWSLIGGLGQWAFLRDPWRVALANLAGGLGMAAALDGVGLHRIIPIAAGVDLATVQRVQAYVIGTSGSLLFRYGRDKWLHAPPLPPQQPGATP